MNSSLGREASAPSQAADEAQSHDSRPMTTCPVCGEVLERSGIRCRRCGASIPAPDGFYILTAGQSLAYRLARSIAMAAGGALAGTVAFATALGVAALLPLVLTSSVLPVIQAAVMLAGIFAAVIGFSAILVSFAELQRNASLEVSKDVLRFNDLQAELEIDLAEVRCVRVDQGWLARLFRYGAIEIFTDRSPKPAAVIPGVSHPHSFKEEFELILNCRETNCELFSS
jgi:uncharacterized membrane protein YdbT with pleckstrin-like domain